MFFTYTGILSENTTITERKKLTPISMDDLVTQFAELEVSAKDDEVDDLIAKFANLSISS